MKRAFDSVLKAGASRPAPAYLRDHHRTIAWVAAGVSLVYAAVAVAFKIYEYADGSWFSFALVSGHPFQLIWRDYAGRLAAYALYVAPAQALMRFGTAPRLALDVYASLYYLTPVASLGAAHGLLARAERWRIVWPALFFLTLGVLTWGFPTEVWLTSAVAWPLAFVFQSPGDNRGRILPATLLLAIFVFSHESWLILAPVIAVAHVRALRRPDQRWVALIWGAIALATIIAWITVKQLLRPDPLIAAALAANAREVFNPLIWMHNVTALKSLALAAVAVTAAAMTARAPGRRGLILGATILIGLGVILAPHRFNGVSRYTIRGAVVLAEAVLMAFAVFMSDAAGTAGAEPRRASSALTLLLPALIVLNLVESGAFAASYIRYRALVATEVAQPGPPLALASHGLIAAPAHWEWALPFQSYLASAGKRILYSDFGRAQLEPLACDPAKRLGANGSADRAAAFKGIAAYACRGR